jgi:hypothetical protein
VETIKTSSVSRTDNNGFINSSDNLNRGIKKGGTGKGFLNTKSTKIDPKAKRLDRVGGNDNIDDGDADSEFDEDFYDKKKVLPKTRAAKEKAKKELEQRSSK